MAFQKQNHCFTKTVVLFFGLYPTLILSQINADQFEIKGKITYKNSAIENAHVINISNKKNSVSNEKGEFNLVASINDTLEVRTLAFQFETIIISEEKIKNNSLNIKLSKRVNELKEVMIGSNGLTGDLEKDLLNIPYNVIDPSKKLGIEVFQGEPQEKIPTVMQTLNYGMITHVQLEPLYKHISGYYKRLKDKRKFNHGTKTIDNILYFYSASFFENHYHIAPNEIYNFLFFCLETEDDLITTLENKNYSALLEIFDKKALLFNK